MKIRLSRANCFKLIWTILPALLWLLATYSRGLLIQPICAKLPIACVAESVPSVDRFSLGMEDPLSDEYSYRTQNSSGVLGFALPLTWTGFRLISRSISPGFALTSAIQDAWTVLQVISWNGLFTEVSHLISQRARPFVYSNPAERGKDPAHYTSFYSGHTSFTAATTVSAVVILVRNKAPTLICMLAFALSQALILSTAYFRIMAGRHFLTDVICGAIAGTLIAFWISRQKK